jgi:heme-degrading monooxygenase HmoA
MMYARHVSYTLKPNRRDDFIKAFEKDVTPLLQKQNGFTDVITFISPDGKSLIAISLWERKENADAFGREGYPQALKSVAGTFEGTPEVRGYEVATSTFAATH